jgi:hypothetical protein
MDSEECECYEKTVFGGCVHLIILGSGASKALVDEFGGTEETGKILPIMTELIEVTRINDIIKKHGFVASTDNIEEFYSEHMKKLPKPMTLEIEQTIKDYFEDMEIPEAPTIYDYLVLSLRPKDAIATFNWDPLLLQAYRRVGRHLGEKRLPHLIFLHGNVLAGYCRKDNIPGLVNGRCSECGNIFQPIPLLYPTAKKDYEKDPFIKLQWKMLDSFLKRAKVVTVFGYGRPVSDIAAINAFRKSWGKKEKRAFEQFELILKPGADREKARESWDDLIHTHHFHTSSGFYDSWLYRFPRRSGEQWFCQFFQNTPLREHSPPRKVDLSEIIKWHQFLFDEEDKIKSPEAKLK